MEINIIGGEDTQPNDSSPQITDSIIEQRSNEDAGKCDRFSIRKRSRKIISGRRDAYVAEIRKRDWKTCWPFCSSVECKDPNDHEEFRCWYCQNCLYSSDALDDTADTCVVPNIYEDKDCEGNVDVTSYEYLPLINLVRENSSSVMSNTKIRHSVFAYRKIEKNVEKTAYGGISELTCIRRKDIQSLNEENVSRNAEITNLDVGGGPKYGILDFEFGDRKIKCKRTCSNETRYRGDPLHRVPEMAKNSEKGIYLQLPETEGMESGSLDSQPSYDRNLCSSKSNQSDQNKDTEGVHGEKLSNKYFCSTEILKCKRPQKVRLLSDILRGEISGGSFDLSSSNGTVNSDDMDTRVTDTEAADDSDDLTLDTLFRSQKVIQTNTRKIIGFRNNKKRPQVEDMGPGQSRWSNGESEVLWSQNSNKENNSVQSVIGSSESVKTDFSRDVALVNRAEKRQRKSSYEDRRSFSKMSQENLTSKLIYPENKETQTGTGNPQFHLPNDIPTLLKLNVDGSQDCDQKSIFCVKEGHGKGSLMPPREFVPMKKRVGGKDVCIDPYIQASYKGSDSRHHLKNKHGTFKRKKGSSFSSNNISVRANLEVTEIPSSEMDALDDISMEIVKLLAENRREKLLLEAETANRDTVSLLRSVNRVENPHKVQPTKAYDDVKSTNLRKNTIQVQRKPFRVGEDTFDEIKSSGMEIVPQGGDPHNVRLVNKPTKINSTQISATSSPKQRKPLDVKIYSKKTAEKPCACVKKITLMSPKLDASLTISSNERRKRLTFEEPMVHIHSTERNNDCTQIGGTRGQFSGNIVSGSVKSCKKGKLKSSMAAMEAMNGRVNGHGSGKNTLGTNYQSFSFNKVQSSASDYIVLPVEPNKKKKGAVAWGVKGGEICSVNRNPADFSIPGTGNKFMRRGRSENSRT